MGIAASCPCHVPVVIDGLAAPVGPPTVGVPGQQAALAVVTVHPTHVHGHLHHSPARAHVQHRLREGSRGADPPSTHPSAAPQTSRASANVPTALVTVVLGWIPPAGLVALQAMQSYVACSLIFPHLRYK